MKRITLVLLSLMFVAFVHFAYTQIIDSDNPENIDPIDPDEEPFIRLNPDDPTYDTWKKIRDMSGDKREPGPINVQRFDGHVPWVGIPTFFHLPIALTTEDLVAGDVEVAIMGAELIGDMRARSWGPMEMRNPHKSEVYHNWGSWGMEDISVGVNPFDELTVVDYGDAPIDPMSIDRTEPEIRKMVRQIASTKLKNGKNTIPVIIGGGHALMYPDVAGLVDVYGKGNVGVIHFDAHADHAPVAFGHLISHGNPVRKLLEDSLVPGKNFIQIGLRGPNTTDMRGLEWASERGLRYHTMSEIERRGWDAVMEDAIREATEGPEYIFISFDVDVVDPAFIPGTATPEPGGLTMREIMPIVRRLCAETNVVGFELVELRPDSDPGYTTMLNCKAILRQALNGFALRKKGITEPNYLDPRALDDGN